jgi:hypothetical protein
VRVEDRLCPKAELVGDAVHACHHPQVSRGSFRRRHRPLLEDGVHVIRKLPGKISA